MARSSKSGSDDFKARREGCERTEPAAVRGFSVKWGEGGGDWGVVVLCEGMSPKQEVHIFGAQVKRADKVRHQRGEDEPKGDTSVCVCVGGGRRLKAAEEGTRPKQKRDKPTCENREKDARWEENDILDSG